MNLESQVTSLELSKKLEELGVKQESYFYWCEYTYYNDERILTTDWLLKDKKQQIKELGLCFSAFTVAELGEMLPVEVNCRKLEDGAWQCALIKTGHIEFRKDKNQANAMAQIIVLFIGE